MLTPRRAAGAAGFTVIEVVVALAIMVTIAAVVSPSLLGFLDRARVDRAVESLETLAEAVSEFHDDTREHPSALSNLSTPVTAGSRPNAVRSTGISAYEKGPSVPIAWYFT